MTIIANKNSKEYRFERNNTVLRSKYQPEAVNLVLGLFNVRKNYLSYKLVDGKREGHPITITDKSLAKFKGRKPHRFLTDQMIINAMEGSVDYMYGVGFGQSHYIEEKDKWYNYEINYGLIDLDHKPNREVDYYSTPKLVVEAFEKYNIKLHITESSETGKHCYFFLDFHVPPQSMARVMKYICKVETLKIKDGLLELYPNVKVKKGSRYKAHRLPCQPGSSHNIEEFAQLIQNGESSITNTEFNDLLKKSFERNQTKDKFYDQISKGWTSSGQTYQLTYNITLWHRIYGDYETKQELHNLCLEFVRSSPGYRKHCGHQHEIEEILWSKLDFVWDRYYKYQNAKRYTKRETLEKERLPKIKKMLKAGQSINQIAKSLNADKRTISKLINKHNLKLDIQVVANSHIHFIYPKDKVNIMCENTTTNIQNENIQNEITNLSRSELKSVLNKKGNVNITKLANILGCHRKTIKLSKAELTDLVTELLKPKPTALVVAKSNPKQTKSSKETNNMPPITANNSLINTKVEKDKPTLKIPIQLQITDLEFIAIEMGGKLPDYLEDKLAKRRELNIPLSMDRKLV